MEGQGSSFPSKFLKSVIRFSRKEVADHPGKKGSQAELDGRLPWCDPKSRFPVKKSLCVVKGGGCRRWAGGDPSTIQYRRKVQEQGKGGSQKPRDGRTDSL